MSDPALAREYGLFVVEGRFVVERLLDDGRFTVESLLLSDAALAAMGSRLATLGDEVPIFVLRAEHFEGATGFNIHRGCLALAIRPAPRGVDDCIAGTRRLLVLEGITNADNVGGIFRNAAAFDVDAVLLGPGCCDPLYRKAIRTSMGATLRLPFAEVREWPDVLTDLSARGFAVLALTPQPPATTLDEIERQVGASDNWALVLGTEGDGLTDAALARAKQRVRIPISSAVDSLNVAVACGIALSRLSVKGTL